MEVDLSDTGITPEQQQVVIERVNKAFEESNKSVREVNSALKTEKQEAKEKAAQLQKQLDSLSGSAEKAAELQAKLDKIKASGGELDREELEKELRAEIAAELGEKYDGLDSQVKSLEEINQSVLAEAEQVKETLETVTKEQGLTAAFLKLKANPEMLRAASIMTKDTVTIEDSEGNMVKKPVVSVDNQGRVTFRSYEDGKILSDERGSFTFTDWVQYLHDNKHLTVFSDAQGMNTNGGGIKEKGMYKSEMTNAQKAEYKKQFGYAAYNALPFAREKK